MIYARPPVYVVLYRGISWVSALIRWQTRGAYSHAALCVDGAIYEAREFRPVRQRAPEASELTADWFVVAHPVDADALHDWLARQLGKPYDYLAVARFVTREQGRNEAAGKWFCSELVYAALTRLGAPVLARTEPWEVSPALLARSPLLIPTPNPLTMKA